MAMESVLLEYSKEEIFFSSSAILLNKRWVILPAASLIITLSNEKTISKNIETIETSKINCNNFLGLVTEGIKIVLPAENQENFRFHLAKYVGIFSCKNIIESSDFPLGCGDDKNSDFNFNNLLSLFLIFDMKMKENFEEKLFFNCINDILKLSSNLMLCRGNKICIESSPFGARELLSSYSSGILCNFAGKNNVFILTDAPTAPGSEGAPIYAFKNNNKKSTKLPIGIVISSLNWWRGEHTGLSLGVFLPVLLSQLLPKKWSIKEYLFSNKNSIISSAEKSIVQVFCGNGWGTGILIDKKLGIFVTGSHVVNTGKTDKITIKWRNKSFPANLIFRTENSSYDIAIISCAVDQIDKMLPIKFAIKSAVKGENVLAAGYPIFDTQDFIFPVLTKGNISLVDHCILHTTCCILAGSSGGAILRENGDLLGIIVCHTTVSLKDETVVYPKINMAIPISAVKSILLEYIKTKDVNVFKSLEKSDAYIKNRWQLFKSKL